MPSSTSPSKKTGRKEALLRGAPSSPSTRPSAGPSAQTATPPSSPNPMTKYPLLLGLLLLLLLPTAAALGVTPAQTIIHYQPGLRQTVTLNIVNNEHKEFQAVLYPQGPLAKYIRVKEAILRIPADQYLTPASYEVSFPSEDLEPGDHETDIVIMQLPDQFLSESENALITDSGTVIFPNKGQAL